MVVDWELKSFSLTLLVHRFPSACWCGTMGVHLAGAIDMEPTRGTSQINYFHVGSCKDSPLSATTTSSHVF